MPLLIDPREDPMCLCKEFVNPKKGQGPRALQQNPQESASATRVPECRKAQGFAMGLRVLVAFGSETGNSERIIKKIVGRWKSADSKGTLECVEVVKGSQTKTLAEIKTAFDVILIATSSFGEGDPPDNFAPLLLKLCQGASSQEMPLSGMQHAVLGFGASVYDTYQNTPRLTDKVSLERASHTAHSLAFIPSSHPDAAILCSRRSGSKNAAPAALHSVLKLTTHRRTTRQSS